jgi:putative ABC transport system permease protein
MPEGYQVLNPDTDVWLYQADSDLLRATRSPSRLFTLIGRLKPGVTIVQAQAETDRIAQVIGTEFPETHLGWGLRVESLRDAGAGGWRQLLRVFQGAVLLVLLLASSNVAALVMSRAAAQQKELAVRSALGMGRWRLVRQLLTDNLVLSVLGAASVSGSHRSVYARS